MNAVITVLLGTMVYFVTMSVWSAMSLILRRRGDCWWFLRNKPEGENMREAWAQLSFGVVAYLLVIILLDWK